MDKQLFKAYVRTIVEEEVKRLVPQMISEIMRSSKPTHSNFTMDAPADAQISLAKNPNFTSLREAIDFSDIISDRGDIVASTANMNVPHRTNTNRSAGPANTIQGASNADPAVLTKINRNYSELLKAMKVT